MITQRPEYSGKCWENKRFAIGKNFLARKKDLEESWESNAYEHEVTRGEEAYKGRLGSDPIGLSTATILTRTAQSRSRKGLKGISGKGKLMVANAGLRLQRKWGKRNIGFTTLTLPALPEKLWENLKAEDFQQLEAAIRKLFLHILGKHKVSEITYVIEIQELRYKETGYPYPHWHILHPSKKAHIAREGCKHNPWFIDANILRRKWEKIVWNWIYALGKKHDCTYGKDALKTMKTFKASIDMQTIKKDASRYIAKYASKGVKCIDAMIDNAHIHLIPCQWWYVSTSLKKEVIAHITNIKETIARQIFMQIVHMDAMENNPLFEWTKIIEREKDDGSVIVVCVIGQVTELGMRIILNQ